MVTFSKLSLAVLFSLSLSAPLVQADEFSTVYRQFQQAVSDEDDALSLTLSQQAWKLGEDKFGEDSENALMLQHSYANMLVRNQQFEKAFEQFEALPGRYEDLYGGDSKQTLMAVAEVLDIIETFPPLRPEFMSEEANLARFLVNHADDVTYQTEQEQAKTYYIIAKVLAKSHINSTSVRRTQKFLEKSLQMNTRLFGEQSGVSIESRLFLSQVQIARDRKAAAIENLEYIISNLDSSLEFSHPYALMSHARLVDLYEKSGESEKATVHCQAIGKMTPWDDDIDAQPLYRLNPEYPKQYTRLGKNGSVKLSFTIDKQGFVKNINVVEVSGGEQFEAKALEALQKWRYAPKFVDGQPVDAPENYVQLDFKIVS